MTLPIPNLFPTFSLGPDVFDLNGHDLSSQPGSEAFVQASLSAPVEESSIVSGAATVSLPKASEASNGIASLFSGLATLPQQIAQWAAGLWVAAPDVIKQDSTLSAASAAPVSRPSLYERNCTEIQKLLNEIDGVLRDLDAELQRQDPQHRPVMPSSLRPRREQTHSEYARSWGYFLRGGGSAATSAMGWGTVAAGLPYIAGLTGNIFAQAAGLLGGGYLGLNILRNIPDQTRQNAVNLAVHDAMQKVEQRQCKLRLLIQQEFIRKNAMDRVIAVAAERQQRVQALENKLAALTAALNAAPAVPAAAEYINATGLCIDSLSMGDGENRQQSLSWLASAQRAFQAFFSSVNTGLSAAGNAIGYRLSSMGQTIHRVIAIPGTLLDRYTAYRAESAYQNGEGKSLILALTTPTDGAGIVDVSFRNSQEQYRQACGFSPPQAEIRNQLHMGQNIAHALAISDDPTPGTVVLASAQSPMTATSNLMTTRALAWYLDAAADHPAEAARDAAAPTVRRLPDDSLLIDDPHSHFYDFLMQAPTTYTVSMVDAKEQDASWEPGVFRLHDYYAGFPRGCRGVQFERTVDEKTGAFALRMRLVKDAGTFGIQPAAIPLREDGHIANRVHTHYGIHQANHSILATDDYQKMSQEELTAARAFVIAELERHAKLGQSERQQLEHLESWEHPNYRRLVA
ncbi:hypothetical protein [Bordetella genomosp. 4]|uniref:hypothetical protein n=1 Tax=Bordetella genomosp. 4 TaxID=463044 RepID=UPI0011406C79|nr:hypothetical protein [Bordetella genomosp. 4]